MKVKCIECKLKKPYFNYKNEKKGLYCGDCKKQYMIDVVHKKCIECNLKQPYFNYKNEKKGLYCRDCKKENMIDVISKKCIECKIKRPNFNYKTEKKGLYCGDCKKQDMIDVKNKKCIECNLKIPYFNYKTEKKGLYCRNCKKQDMIDVKNKKCEKCNKVYVYNKYIFCAICDDAQRCVKKQEYHLRDLFEAYNFKFLHNNRFYITKTKHYNPDFLFETEGFIFIIECDENAHRSYCNKKEEKRIKDIKNNCKKPVKFIKYNPDNRNFTDEHKEKVLVETINNLFNCEIFDETTLFLFY